MASCVARAIAVACLHMRACTAAQSQQTLTAPSLCWILSLRCGLAVEIPVRYQEIEGAERCFGVLHPSSTNICLDNVYVWARFRESWSILCSDA